MCLKKIFSKLLVKAYFRLILFFDWSRVTFIGDDVDFDQSVKGFKQYRA